MKGPPPPLPEVRAQRATKGARPAAKGAALEAATTGAAYGSWWQAHLPALADWDALVVFDPEWETAVLQRLEGSEPLIERSINGGSPSGSGRQ